MTEKTFFKWKSVAAFVMAIMVAVTTMVLFPDTCRAEDYSAVVTLANDKNSDIYVEVTRHSGGNHDWQEYGYLIKNNDSQAVSGVTITVPAMVLLPALSAGESLQSIVMEISLFLIQRL